MTTTTKQYPDFTRNSLVVQKRRYWGKDRDGNVLEDAEGMFCRVAHDLAQAERMYLEGPKAQGKITQEEIEGKVREVEEDFYDLMVKMAWETGDPGIWFIDRVNQAHPNKHLGQIESTNPCGESALLPYESCNLGSINLANHLERKSGPYDDEIQFVIDYDHLERTCRRAVRLLDNVIDRNRYPLVEIAEASRRSRRIGVGVMGWADMLVRLGIKYDSETALQLAEDVMAFIRDAVHAASSDLAHERGNYPAWEGSEYQKANTPMRNTSPVTIAPTGTISIIAGCSSGIEPLFGLAYVRNVMDNDRLAEGYPFFEAVAKQEGFYSEELMRRLADTGSLESLDVPQWVKEVFRTAHDISPEWHVRMQAAFQKHTDNAVSKTINLPTTATVEDVAHAYMLACETGCKGITIYRDGSKEGQVLSFPSSNGHQPAEANPSRLPWLTPRQRPRVTNGITQRLLTGHGNMYVTINQDESGQPFEVFGHQGKAGGCDSAQMEAVTRLVSLALRSGVDPAQVVEQLQGITCCPAWDEGVLVRSGPDAIALALGLHLGLHGGFESRLESPVDSKGRKCPDCNGVVQHAEGCTRCSECGWSNCG
jgi:ribonucleoside-diphosphate reductase alpha chain